MKYLTCFFLVCGIVNASHGDVLKLRNGGAVRGKVKRDKNHYIVKLDTGGYVKLDIKQVKRHIKPAKNQLSYEQLLPSMPDSAESHWKMAEFCRKNRLVDQKTFHAERTLELDPNHEQARKMLGYFRRDGQWIRQDEWLQQRGLIRHNGTWILPQQAAIMDRNREIELRQKKIRLEIKRWRGWLGGRRDREAREGFASLQDPMAVKGLIEFLKQESDPAVRDIYVDTLSRFPGRAVTSTLVETAIHDDDEEVQDKAIEALIAREDQSVATHLAIPYLLDNRNRVVNQAGFVLGKLGHFDAVRPLIDSLVTKHTRIVYPEGNVRPSFSSSPNGGGIGLSAGTKPKKKVEEKENRGVRDALVNITGQNFQYSEQHWKNWYMRQQTPTSFNLRRDL